MIDWKAVDAAFYATVIGLSMELASRAGSPILAAWVVVICCVVPFYVYFKGAAHNPSASKRIRGLNLFIGSVATTFVLEFGLPIWSLETFGLVGLGYLSTLILTWKFSSWAGRELKIPKRMFISSGWVLGSFVAIASFVLASFVGIGYDVGLRVMLSLPFLTLLLVVGYPFGLLVVWVSKIVRLAPVLYSRRQYGRTRQRKSWRESLRARQEWNDISLLTMGMDSGLKSRRVLVMLALSMASFLSLTLTAHSIAFYGWGTIALQGGLANLLLVGSEVSYFRLGRAEFMNSAWVPK